VKILDLIPQLEPEEFQMVQYVTKDLNEEELKQFAAMYKSKRKDTQTILILTVLGFVVVAGVQRFMLNQIGMGILYLLTAGLCFVGTIIDLVNHKEMTQEYNRKEAEQIVYMIRNQNFPAQPST
jgi:TM2 domain-containing membrane protein YozV